VGAFQGQFRPLHGKLPCKVDVRMGIALRGATARFWRRVASGRCAVVSHLLSPPPAPLGPLAHHFQPPVAHGLREDRVVAFALISIGDVECVALAEVATDLDPRLNENAGKNFL
jgi:hypothetical protein